MKEISFRPLQKEDVARVAELERLCFRSPWSERALAGELKNPAARYRVGLVEGRIEAYAGMWILYEEAHITNVAVSPDFRRRGLGRAIMLEMLQAALFYGASQMTLEVRESNLAAQALYDGLDFENAGHRKRYYADTNEDALIMWNRDIAKTFAALNINPKHKGELP